MGVAGVIVTVTDWSENARRAAQRAAYIGAELGAHTLLVHTVPHGWMQRIEGVDKLGAVRSGIQLVERLAQYIYEKTGFVMNTQVHLGRADTLIVQASNAADTRLITLGQWSNLLSRNNFARQLLRQACGPVLFVKRKPDSVYRRVLVAVDGSAHSAACIEQARAIAPDADMVVVWALDHALEDRLRYADASEEKIREYRIRRHEKALDRLNALLANAGVPSHRVVKIVERGYAPKLILDTEREFLIDLLVIGRSDASFLKRCFFQSVSPLVVEKARSDVLVVPAAHRAND
jgi:nucleotide-binding universal stress UspA family protein